jgi:Steigviridae/Suoliviridae L,D-carboxypeptidase/transpeptidase
MELELTRSVKTNKSTIGELTVNGIFECFILEDKDRGLRKDMPISELIVMKIKTRTAIPTGRYEIVVSFSDKFQKMLPLLLDVPAFAGIRIHPGNTDANTEGCLLPGKTKSPDMIGSSRVAFTALFDKIKAALQREKIFITVK